MRTLPLQMEVYRGLLLIFCLFCGQMSEIEVFHWKKKPHVWKWNDLAASGNDAF